MAYIFEQSLKQRLFNLVGGVVLFNLMEGVTYVKVREIVYEAGFENGEWLKKKKKKERET